MRVHLVNPSDLSFGTAVITPRWLYVLARWMLEHFGTPSIVDETLEPFDPESVQPGDVVGIGIHTANVLRGYQVGRIARERGAVPSSSAASIRASIRTRHASMVGRTRS